MSQQAVVYAYHASPEDAERLVQQVEECQTYCREKGLSVVGVFQEMGVREGRARLMAELKKGEVEVLVLSDWSRLSRDMAEHKLLVKEIVDSGVSVEVVSAPGVPYDFIMSPFDYLAHKAF